MMADIKSLIIRIAELRAQLTKNEDEEELREIDASNEVLVEELFSCEKAVKDLEEKRDLLIKTSRKGLAGSLQLLKNQKEQGLLFSKPASFCSDEVHEEGHAPVPDVRLRSGNEYVPHVYRGPVVAEGRRGRIPKRRGLAGGLQRLKEQRQQGLVFSNPASMC